MADKEQMYQFINPNGNDKLSEMNGRNLQNLIILLDDYYLKLRDNLSLDNDITFGLEIEFEKAQTYEFEKEMERLFPYGLWSVVHDSSLLKGLEIDSPVLKDNSQAWKDVNIVCEIAKKYGLIDRKAGSHVHVGAHILGKDIKPWLNLIKLWSVYENIVFRFAYGTFLTFRPRIREYAKPVSKEFWDEYLYLRDNYSTLGLFLKRVTEVRNQAINFTNVSYSYNDVYAFGNTIEFRCPNGTLDAIIWQNNVNLFTKMLLACKDLSCDDVIDKRHELITSKYDELRWYDEIYLDQALEFADIVFTNNLDKLYFLKQYLKSMQICDRKVDYPNEKTITKKMF